MNISEVLSIVNGVLDNVRVALAPLPAVLVLATAVRRPSFSAVVTAPEIHTDAELDSENDEVVAGFICNVVEKIKTNIQDDAVCFIAIPPKSLELKLIGANGGGPIVLEGTNINFIFALAIIR